LQDYYDINDDLGTELLKTTLTGDNNLSGDSPYGVTYTTTEQNKDFEQALWGNYKVIGFLGEEYFGGYNAGNGLYSESFNKNSLSSEQLEKIIVDDDTELTLNKGESIKLKDGLCAVL